MYFLEDDLEQIIFKTPVIKLRERGLPIYGHKFRQVDLGDYGRLDIATVRDDGYGCGGYVVSVYELKRDVVNVDAFWQAIKYAKCIQLWFRKYRPNSYVVFEIYLVGKSLDFKHSMAIFLPDLFDNIYFYTYSYEFDGIRFKKNNNFYIQDTYRKC